MPSQLPVHGAVLQKHHLQLLQQHQEAHRIKNRFVPADRRLVSGSKLQFCKPEPVNSEDAITFATSAYTKSIAINNSNELNFGSKPTVKFSINFSIEPNNQTKTALTLQQVKGMLNKCLMCLIRWYHSNITFHFHKLNLFKPDLHVKSELKLE